MKAITIPLSEYDIELFKELLCCIEDEIEWEFLPDGYSILDTDETIKVKFVREEEEDEDEDDTDE